VPQALDILFNTDSTGEMVRIPVGSVPELSHNPTHGLRQVRMSLLCRLAVPSTRPLFQPYHRRPQSQYRRRPYHRQPRRRERKLVTSERATPTRLAARFPTLDTVSNIGSGGATAQTPAGYLQA